MITWFKVDDLVEVNHRGKKIVGRISKVYRPPHLSDVHMRFEIEHAEGTLRNFPASELSSVGKQDPIALQAAVVKLCDQARLLGVHVNLKPGMRCVSCEDPHEPLSDKCSECDDKLALFDAPEMPKLVESLDALVDGVAPAHNQSQVAEVARLWRAMRERAEAK